MKRRAWGLNERRHSTGSFENRFQDNSLYAFGIRALKQ